MSVVWEPDSASPSCRLCNRKWTVFGYRRHHCRHCGKLVCYKCSTERIYLTIQSKKADRVCDKCAAEIHSTERPKLPQGVEDESDDEARSIISVVSDGKCKATETPFRNTMSLDKAPSLQVQKLVDVQERGDSEPEPLSDDSDDDDEEIGPVHHLQLEEVGLHRSTSNISNVGSTPLSPPPTSNTEGTDGIEQPDVLADLKEGLHRESSATTERTLKVSISKFGNMAFSDDENTSGPSSAVPPSAPDSASSNAAQAFAFDVAPGSSDCAEETATITSPGAGTAGGPAVAMVVDETPLEATAPTTATEGHHDNVAASPAGSPEKVTAEGQTATVEAAERSDTPDAGSVEGRGSASSVISAGTEGASTSPKGDATKAATATTPGSAPKNKGPAKVVLKKRASVAMPEEKHPWDASTSSTGPAVKLHPGMSPMPIGGTVRRLSTVTPRTPFNSDVHMSPAAAEIAKAQAAARAAAEAAAAEEALARTQKEQEEAETMAAQTAKPFSSVVESVPAQEAAVSAPATEEDAVVEATEVTQAQAVMEDITAAAPAQDSAAAPAESDTPKEPSSDSTAVGAAAAQAAADAEDAISVLSTSTTGTAERRSLSGAKSNGAGGERKSEPAKRGGSTSSKTSNSSASSNNKGGRGAGVGAGVGAGAGRGEGAAAGRGGPKASAKKSTR